MIRPDLPAPAVNDRPRVVSKIELLTGFLQIGLMGFGGVAPWARRVLVEEWGWMSDEDFAAILGVGQILPGANMMNAAVIIGDRFQGVVGSLIAVMAMLAAPLAILVSIASAYDRFAAVPDVQGALNGVAAGAAGLVIGTGIKMASKLKLDALTVMLGAGALVAVAVLKVSLVATLLVLAPLGVTATLLRPRA